jgi:hypothetical protein
MEAAMTTEMRVGEDDLHFGWYIPTSGDTSAFGVPEASIPPDLDMFTRVARAVENAGIEFALVPVVVSCYEAWISCAMMSARTERLKMLVGLYLAATDCQDGVDLRSAEQGARLRQSDCRR